ncbi:MAG: acyl carrier protein [Lysobacteraceae bacterium]
MNKEDIFALIAQNAREIMPQLESHEFQWTDSLRALGANSIDRSEIVMMTLEAMTLDIPLAETIHAENIGALATLLYEKESSRQL